MRRFDAIASLVFAITVMSGGVAGAASYVKTDGTIVDPILCNSSGGCVISTYLGPDLAPYVQRHNADLGVANLTDADLDHADLTDADAFAATLTSADLSYATLVGVYFGGAVLTNADLSNANLTFANFTNANVTNADLTNANLFSAELDLVEFWSSATWSGARYSLGAVDNSGNPIPDTIFRPEMDQVWRDAAGMVAVPEPSTALLLGLGLAGMAIRKRR